MTGPASSSAPRSTPSAPCPPSRWSRSHEWAAEADEPRCTSTSPSRSPRTRRASRSTPARPPRCSPTTACSARARRPSTPPTSPRTTSACSGESRTYAGFCPTTERDLGDGIGPSRRLHDAGSRLTLGSDSHAVIDLFEEMRAVELDERLATQQRGHWSAAELLAAATTTGHASLGFDDAGAIAVGQRADLVTDRHHQPAHRRHRRRREHRRLRRRGRGRHAGDGRRPRSWSGRVTASEIGRELDAAIGADLGGDVVTSTVLTNIGELVTNDPEAADLLGIVEHAALVVEGGRVAWVGPADRRTAGRRAGRRRRPRRAPRLRRQPQPPGLRRRPGAGVRGPDGRRELRRRRHPHHRRGHPRGHRRGAHQPRRPAGRRDAPAGHHHGGDQERLRPHRVRRGARPRGRAAVHRRDDVPRRARRARRQRPRGVRRPGDRPDARGRRPARPLDRRVLRARRLRRRPGPPDPRGRRGRRAAGAGCTPTSSAPARASGWPPSSGCSRSTTAPTSRTPTSTPSATRAPSRPCCRASSSRRGSPTPTPAG